MDWFLTWWESLGIVSQAFACVAIPATIIMVLQSLLLLLGIGFDGGGDVPSFDCDTDGDCSLEFNHDVDGLESTDMGMQLFTIRGIIAFFAIGGWIGIMLIDLGIPEVWAGLSAFAAGTLALVISAYMIKWFMKLQDSGNVEISNAIAKTGTVYIKVPPERAGTGQVSVVVQGRLTEFSAITDHSEPLTTHMQVQVVGIVGDNTLVVSPTFSGDSKKQ